MQKICPPRLSSVVLLVLFLGKSRRKWARGHTSRNSYFSYPLKIPIHPEKEPQGNL
jgi:hypothetical protein